MIELDYAFLAEYATIQDNKLTTIGASFTRMQVLTIPTEATLSVAGRIRTPSDIDELTLHVRATPPNQSYQLDGSLALNDLTSLPEYGEGRRGTVFALQFTLPLTDWGLYTIEVDLDETEGIDRTLKFELAQA